MKKLFVLIWVVLMFATLLGTQMFVVGEVFTSTTCGYCPAARSALRTMAEDSGTFPHFIPLIWQLNANTSPNASVRGQLYGVSGIPHAQWGGQTQVVGAGASVLNNYTNAYNNIAAIQSPINLNIDFEINQAGNLVAVANVELLQNISTTNNKIIFILTHNFDATQPGDYFASVVRYHEQNFELTSQGQTAEFTQEIALNQAWSEFNTRLVVIIQTMSGNKAIHQAAMKRLTDIIPVQNLRSFNNEFQVSLIWDIPETTEEISGYKIYKDNELLNEELHQLNYYTDTDVYASQGYSYYVVAVYEDTEATPSETINVTPMEGYVQLGSGSSVNGTQSAGPVNVYYRSLRGQTIYTAEELHLAGISGQGSIESIAFYIHNRPIHNLPNYNVRIKHTTASTPTAHDNGPFESTTIIPSYAPVNGTWDEITLSQPFHWNGVDNILIDTAFDLVPNYNASGQVRIFNTANGYRYTWNDNSSQVNVATNTLANYRPQLVFTFVPEATQNPPQNLVAEAGDGVVHLSWDAPVENEFTLEGYNVYRDGEMINTSFLTDTEFTDNNVENDVTYTYYVTAVYSEGESLPSNTVEATPGETSTDDISIIPLTTKLGNNYPNPFNPSTTIQFDLNSSNNVKLEIFNIKGQLIKTLANNFFTAGRHYLNWDGKDNNGNQVSSGIYLYKMQSGDYANIKKMIMMK